MNRLWHTRGLLALMCLVMIVWPISACSQARAVPKTAPQGAQAAQAVRYQSFELPGPVPAAFELPEDWGFWGNGGWLSPDAGKTLGGLRLTFLKPGQDAGRLLYNEDSVLIDKSTVTLQGVEWSRYRVHAFLKMASTGELVSEGFELIYAIPVENNGIMAGVFVRAANPDQLNQLEPVVQHMATSLKFKSD
jgi:hypothetical protein